MKDIDIARVSFDPRKNFSALLKQQGRVELESDWNEQAAITLHILRTMMADLIGAHGGPQHECGFRIRVFDPTRNLAGLDEEMREALTACEPGDFVVTRGRYYVDGLLCENHRPFRFAQQRRHPCACLEELPGHCHLVFIDVWEREVTALEDPGLREIALGGADTAARLQVAWRVRTMPIARAAAGGASVNTSAANLSPPWAHVVKQLQPPHRGAMSARTRPAEEVPDDDDPQSESGSYRGLENQLYRIEIHRGGKPQDGRQGPTFKWSRDNGIAAHAVGSCSYDDERHVTVVLAGLPRDDTARIDVGDWVEFDDFVPPGHQLAGRLLQVKKADTPTRTLQLVRAEPLSRRVEARTNIVGDEDHPLVLRRWDQRDGQFGHGAGTLVDGAIRLREDEWIPIEDGIQVSFAKHPQSEYRAGDYWLVPARVATADVDWPQCGDQPEALPPLGVQHHYAPLAIVDVNGAQTVLVTPLTHRFGMTPLPGLGRDVLACDGD